MKLLVTRRMTPSAEAALTASFDTTLRDSEAALSQDEARAALQSYDAIIPTLGDDFSAAAFPDAPRTRILANFGAGTDHIDLEAAARAGVTVTNTPDVVTESTAELALMLLLMTARRASEAEALLRRGEWTGWQPTQLLGRQITGATVGIVGMGRIGRAIARKLHAGFGARILFHNRSPVSSFDVPARQMPDLEALIDAVDMLILAVPGGAGTRKLVDAALLARMRPETLLINVARGDVIDEDALIAALQSRAIAGAGLDVYAREPNVPEALRRLPNVTLLPHLGTAVAQTRTEMALRALENISAFQSDTRPRDFLVGPAGNL